MTKWLFSGVTRRTARRMFTTISVVVTMVVFAHSAAYAFPGNCNDETNNNGGISCNDPGAFYCYTQDDIASFPGYETETDTHSPTCASFGFTVNAGWHTFVRPSGPAVPEMSDAAAAGFLVITLGGGWLILRRRKPKVV